MPSLRIFDKVANAEVTHDICFFFVVKIKPVFITYI